MKRLLAVLAILLLPVVAWAVDPSDNFNRATLGANWTTVTDCGNMLIADNTKAVGETGSGTNAAYYNNYSFNANQYSQILYQNNNTGVLLRASASAKTYYTVYIIDANTFGVFKMVAGSQTQVGSNIAYGTGLVANTDVVKGTVTGTTPNPAVIKIYVNDIEVGSGVSDSTSPIYGPGYAGIIAYDNTNTMDNWQGGNVGPAAITGTMAADEAAATATVAGDSPHTPTTYYVSPTGNHSPNNGLSTGSPWDLMYAITAVRAGDTVYLRGGDYSSYPNIIGYGSYSTYPGGVGNLISFIAYNNEVPVIHGGVRLAAGGSNWTRIGATNTYYHDFTVIVPGSGVVHYVGEDGIPLAYMGTDYLNVVAPGQYSSVNIGGTTCRVVVWASDSASPDTHSMLLQESPTTYWYNNGYSYQGGHYWKFDGVVFEGGGTSGNYVFCTNGNGVQILNCTFRNYNSYFKVPGYTGNNAPMAFNSVGGVITNCKFYNFCGSAIDITGGDSWTVSGCEIYNSVYCPAAIYIKNDSHDCVIEKNFLHDLNQTGTRDVNTFLIMIGGGSEGSWDGFGNPAGEATNAVIKNNVIANCSGQEYGVLFMGAQGCKFINNTIYNCDWNAAYIVEVPSKSGQSAAPYGSYNCLVENNIWWGNTLSDNTHGGYLYAWFSNSIDFATFGWVIDKNIIDNTQSLKFLWYPSTLKTFADVASDYSWEAPTVKTADPLLLNAGGSLVEDYKITATSPAIGAGADVGLTTDYSGRTYTTNFPIGAWDAAVLNIGDSGMALTAITMQGALFDSTAVPPSQSIDNSNLALTKITMSGALQDTRINNSNLALTKLTMAGFMLDMDKLSGGGMGLGLSPAGSNFRRR